MAVYYAFDLVLGGTALRPGGVLLNDASHALDLIVVAPIIFPLAPSAAMWYYSMIGASPNV